MKVARMSHGVISAQKHLKADSSKCRLREVAAFIGVTLLCCLLLVVVLRLWHASWGVPLDSRGWDVNFTAMQIKTVMEHGWILHNAHVGMPSGLDLHDFILVDSLHFLVIKFLSYGLPSAVHVMNAYYLISFPMSVATSSFAFRAFKVSWSSSIVGAIAFAFLPIHLRRSEGHLFLSTYYMVPLTVMVALWLARGEQWSRGRFVVALIVCALTASSGVYYALFGLFFLTLGAALGVARSRSPRPLRVSTALIVTVCVTFLGNIAPNLLYQQRHGSNPAVAARHAGEADMFGLRIAEMLVPMPAHRVSWLRDVRAKYDRARLTTIAADEPVTLGLLGSAGFVLLLGCALWPGFREETSRPRTLLADLAVFNLSGVLLATIGGFGSLVAIAGFPHLRAYNRISVYLGFSAIFAVVLVLDALRNRFRRLMGMPYIGPMVCVLLVAVVVVDQTSDANIPRYRDLLAEHEMMEAFVRRIEQSTPAGGMIFQLPYVPFPEYPPVHKMIDYDHFRPYLHSTTLRWSYGAMKGRAGDTWQAKTVAAPIEVMLVKIAAAGFTGLYIDRFGYEDLANSLTKRISSTLQREPIMSADQRLLFFDLKPLTRY